MFSKNELVLVIDDMKIMRKIVCKELNNLGFKNTLEAQNGQEAWEKLQMPKVRVGLIISGWNMPTCTGIEFLRRVRSAEDFRKTPFVLITAAREGERIQEAIEAGVDHYIVKPFDHKTFKTKIQEVCNKHESKTPLSA